MIKFVTRTHGLLVTSNVWGIKFLVTAAESPGHDSRPMGEHVFFGFGTSGEDQIFWSESVCLKNMNPIKYFEYPVPSMHGLLFTYIWVALGVNVGKSTIH